MQLNVIVLVISERPTPVGLMHGCVPSYSGHVSLFGTLPRPQCNAQSATPTRRVKNKACVSAVVRSCVL